VLLGAGLDTFAYRNPWPQVRVFEVDAPASEQWKQGALETASVPIPPNVVYAPVDFEHESLMDGLSRAGFDASRPAVFAWLGVALYLTRPAIETTLGTVGALPFGTELVFDYSVPPESLHEPARSAIRDMMANVAARGEPWISFFMPAEIAALLPACGFTEVEDLSGIEINRRWYHGRGDGLAASPVSHIVRARV
jgi:methyltransferase (TIGR00027 family)